VDSAQPDTAAPADEVCDGLDNDEDGLIDEGFPDSDADAVADCVDDTCVLSLGAGGEVSDPNACASSAAPPVDPWNAELMWAADPEVACIYPVVGDLDGDGAVEIVCSSLYDDATWVLDGATGRIEAHWAVFGRESHLALADLDRDGTLEVVGIDPDHLPVAVDASGSPIWRGAIPLAQGPYSMHLEIRDLDGDGSAEVVSHMGAVRGLDGSEWAILDRRNSAQIKGFQVAIDDFDSDGEVELAYGWRGWDVAAGELWDHTPADSDHGYAIPVPVQADADDDAELVWSTMDHFLLAEMDGTQLAERAWSSADAAFPAVPCAGDIDGDGTMELVSPGLNTFHAWELDGSLLWSVPMWDGTNGDSGCTTFDFDLDGAKEVVAVDQDALYILDGATGATLYYGTDGFDTSTAGDVPLVVDLDGDGSVDVLVPSPGNLYGTELHAWRSVDHDWPPGTAMWPSTTWSGTSLLPDGRVPRTPKRPWLTTKVWRGQPEDPVFGSDLRPATGDVCVASCADDGEVRVEVRLENLGPDEVEAGVPLAVYGVDETGARVLLTVFTLPRWLDDGRAAASWEVVTDTAQARRGLVFVAGDDGTGTVFAEDCDTTNSTLAWALDSCL
jgi:hypothetical protein